MTKDETARFEAIESKLDLLIEHLHAADCVLPEAVTGVPAEQPVLDAEGA
jgi:hypothetical protein